MLTEQCQVWGSGSPTVVLPEGIELLVFVWAGQTGEVIVVPYCLQVELKNESVELQQMPDDPAFECADLKVSTAD